MESFLSWERFSTVSSNHSIGNNNNRNCNNSNNSNNNQYHHSIIINEDEFALLDLNGQEDENIIKLNELLSVAFHIISLHHGTVSYTPREPIGNLLCISIPLEVVFETHEDEINFQNNNYPVGLASSETVSSRTVTPRRTSPNFTSNHSDESKEDRLPSKELLLRTFSSKEIDIDDSQSKNMNKNIIEATVENSILTMDKASCTIESQDLHRSSKEEEIYKSFPISVGGDSPSSNRERKERSYLPTVINSTGNVVPKSLVEESIRTAVRVDSNVDAVAAALRRQLNVLIVDGTVMYLNLIDKIINCYLLHIICDSLSHTVPYVHYSTTEVRVCVYVCEEYRGSC